MKISDKALERDEQYLFVYEPTCQDVLGGIAQPTYGEPQFWLWREWEKIFSALVRDYS
jgi:hypothetical protein